MQDRVLLVEPDPLTSDLIARQALQSVGYQVQIVTDAASAINRAEQWSPDLIMIDLNLPGLSGKDLLIALASQGIHTPVIVIAPRGSEADIIQTFRLGAADYLLLPAREAEVVNAVNRALQQVRDRRERDRLAQQLQYANQELQARVRELTTIFSLGKAMTSVTNQAVLLDNILDAALRTTHSSAGWLLLREDANKPFLLAVERGLPAALGAQRNRPWDDSISALVAMSGEVLEIHGEALRRFKISSLGQAAIILPIKSQKTVFGLLVLMRASQPYGQGEQNLLTALADYASISLVNARLFRAVEERAQAYQQGAALSQLAGKVHQDLLRATRKEMAAPARAANQAFQALEHAAAAVNPGERQHALAEMQTAVQRVNAVAAALAPARAQAAQLGRAQVDLVDVLTQSMRRLQPVVNLGRVTFAAAMPEKPVTTCGDAVLLGHVFDSLLTNAIKFAVGGQIGVRLGEKEGRAQVAVFTPGVQITPDLAGSIFLEKSAVAQPAPARFGGLGIRLSLAKEIVSSHEGNIWFENIPNQGVTFFVTLPRTRC